METCQEYFVVCCGKVYYKLQKSNVCQFPLKLAVNPAEGGITSSIPLQRDCPESQNCRGATVGHF